MGGSLIVNFATKDDFDGFKAFYYGMSGPEGGNLHCPEHPLIDPLCLQSGNYVQFGKQPYSTRPHWTVTFEHAIWDQWSSLMAKYFMQEVIKSGKFAVKKVGWCSTGNYKKIDDFLKEEDRDETFCFLWMGITEAQIPEMSAVLKNAAKELAAGKNNNLIRRSSDTD